MGGPSSVSQPVQTIKFRKNSVRNSMIVDTSVCNFAYGVGFARACCPDVVIQRASSSGTYVIGVPSESAHLIASGHIPPPHLHTTCAADVGDKHCDTDAD